MLTANAENSSTANPVYSASWSFVFVSTSSELQTACARMDTHGVWILRVDAGRGREERAVARHGEVHARPRLGHGAQAAEQHDDRQRPQQTGPRRGPSSRSAATIAISEFAAPISPIGTA